MITKRNLILIGFFGALFIINSCTLQKRIYMSGYHIEWLNRKHLSDKQSVNSEIKIFIHEQSLKKLNTANKFSNQNDIYNKTTASVNNNQIIFTSKQLTNEKLFFFKKSSPKKIVTSGKCDIIILMNGRKIEAQILYVENNVIYYKECNNLNSTTFSKNKSEILMIKYSSGRIDGVSNVLITNSNQNNYRNTSTYYSNNTESNDRNKTVALILCILYGYIGLHRFYLGYFEIGLLYLFTFGLCGIGWIFDIILILTGNLKPKDGIYR